MVAPLSHKYMKEKSFGDTELGGGIGCALILIGIALIIFAISFSNCKAMSVGVVSDIHIGKMNKRKSGSSIVYPSKAISYFEKAVKEMKAKGVELIVSLGDNTQVGGSKYYKQLKKIENKYGIKVLWVKGNHDDKNFKILGQNDYIYEQGGIRFAVVDNSKCFFGSCIVKEVNNADIVLQHIPPLIRITCDWDSKFDVERDYTIWSGHFHKEMTCGKVKVFPALTEHKHLTYKIITL